MLQMQAAQSCSMQNKYSTNTQMNKCTSKTKNEKITNNTKVSKFNVQKQVRVPIEFFVKISHVRVVMAMQYVLQLKENVIAMLNMYRSAVQCCNRPKHQH